VKRNFFNTLLCVRKHIYILRSVPKFSHLIFISLKILLCTVIYLLYSVFHLIIYLLFFVLTYKLHRVICHQYYNIILHSSGVVGEWSFVFNLMDIILLMELNFIYLFFLVLWHFIAVLLIY